MNIIFFDFAGPFFPGGCEKYFSILAENFSSKNSVVFIQSKQYIRFMERFYHLLSGHKVGSIDYVKRDIGKSKSFDISFFSLIPFSKSNKAAKELLRKADIIYSKNEFQELLFIYYILGRKEYSRKVIVGVHSAIFIPSSVRGLWKIIHDLQYKSFLYKKFLRSAKTIHVINSDYLNLISKNYKINKARIKYIPYFIDWKTVNTVRQKHEKFIVFWAGRLTQQKGIDRLTTIIEELSKKKNSSNLEFWIAGGGESKTQITELEKKYRNVRFLGFLDNITDIYQKVDLAIVTSYFETFGYNVLEPQSFGLPVISFDIEGPRDIVLQSKTGYLVNNIGEFIERIEELSNGNNAELLEKEGIFKVINDKFSKKKILKNMGNELLIND